LGNFCNLKALPHEFPTQQAKIVPIWSHCPEKRKKGGLKNDRPSKKDLIENWTESRCQRLTVWRRHCPANKIVRKGCGWNNKDGDRMDYESFLLDPS
jgi:hypothetical protein